MSQTKFVSYADQGFWAYDVALSVFLKALVDAAEACGDVRTAWLSAATSYWREVACIPDWSLTLNAEWSPSQHETFVFLAEKACTTLSTRESIPAEELAVSPILDGMQIFLRGAREVATAPVVELGRAIIALTTKQLPEAPKGEIWLYGAPTGRCTLRLLQVQKTK